MKYEILKRRYGKIGSWAIWDDDVHSMKWSEDDNLEQRLKSNIVLVGLNPSNYKEDDLNWTSFHKKGDKRLRLALKGTVCEGAYITDIIKYQEKPLEHACNDRLFSGINRKLEVYSNSESGDVETYLKEHPYIERLNVVYFEEELSYLSILPCPVLIAIGNDAESILKRNLGDKYIILKIPHYSKRNNKIKDDNEYDSVVKGIIESWNELQRNK